MRRRVGFVGIVGFVGLLGCGVGISGTADAAPVATTTAVTLSAASTHPYQPVTATAAVAVPDGSAVSGTVTFTRGGTAVCTSVPVSAGRATCAVAPTATGSAPVVAAFTPAAPAAGTDGAAASTGTSPALAVAVWPVTLKTAYTDVASASCTRLSVTATVTRATGGAAPVAGLPVPSGAVTVAGSSVPLPASGTATVCTGATGKLAVAYGGDARYAAGTTTVIVSPAALPNHTRTGAEPVKPSHTRTGATGGAALANTGPARLADLLLAAAALLLAGLGSLRLGRRRVVNGR